MPGVPPNCESWSDELPTTPSEPAERASCKVTDVGTPVSMTAATHGSPCVS